MFTFSFLGASIRYRVFTFWPSSLPRSTRIVGVARHAELVHPPTSLHDDSSTGCWRVTTQTSAHLVDLGARTVTRIEGGGTPTTNAEYTVSALRRDRETLPLLELVRCQIGHPMTLLLRVRDDRVTARRTTAVIAITPAEE